MLIDIAVTILILTVWAAIHSLMASCWFKRRMRSVMGQRYGYYRIVYNLFSLFSLALAVWLIPVNSVVVYSFEGWIRVLLRVVQVVSFLMVLMSLWELGLLSFTGLERIFSRTSSTSRDESPFRETGLHSISRHPAYLFGILLVLAQPHVTVTIAVLGIGSVLYLLVGSAFEENRLIREHGQRYWDYQRRVPRILPGKWLTRAFHRSGSR